MKNLTLEKYLVEASRGRKSGLEDIDIARKREIPEEELKIYEEIARVKIRNLLDNGYPTRNAAQTLGIGYEYLRDYALFYGVPLSKRVSELNAKRTAAVRTKIVRAIARGLINHIQIAKEAGTAISNVIYHMRKLGVVYEGKSERTVRRIKEAIAGGAKYAEDVAKMTGLSEPRVHMLKRKYNLPIERKPRGKRSGHLPKLSEMCFKGPERNERDDIIKEAGANATLRELGKRMKLSYECVRQYLIKTGQYEGWQKSRRKRTVDRIREAIKEGARYADEIAARIGISEAYVSVLKKKDDIPIERKPYAEWTKKN